MIVLKITEIIIGVILFILGYLIYFKKKYELANDYLKLLNKGLASEIYAKNIGLIYLVGGIVIIIFGVLSFMMSDTFTFIQLGVLFIGMILLLITNPKK